MQKLHSIFIFFIPLVGFAVVLLALNGYQYLQMKNDAATGIATAAGASEREQLTALFLGVEEKLRLIREWEKNEALLDEDITSLNKKFIPLLKQQENIGSVFIADDIGREYMLSKNGDGFQTRLSTRLKNESSLHYQDWSAADVSVRNRRQEINKYDPRTRPWFFHLPDNAAVHWSVTFPFFKSREPGITASVSWETPEVKERFTVFSVCIPLSTVKHIVAGSNPERAGQFFLVSTDGSHVFADPNNKQAQEIQVIPDGLISRWQEYGHPEGELIKLKVDKQQWFAFFQRLGHEQTDIWMGLAFQKNELLGAEDRKFFTIEFFDLAAASVGALLIMVFLSQRGLLQFPNAIPATPQTRLRRYIELGEGAAVEFKSTVRTNLQTGKKGKEIELAWLKAIIAFLNSEGGALLLGVADSGEILGLGADDFENDDRCLLHIKNLLNQHIGVEFSGYITTTLLECPEGPVVMLECSPAGEAVFLKIGKSEEFYVRSGPSSSKLSLSQTVAYLSQRKK